ncbi:MAG: hypothetical protein ABSD50_06905 [Smithella sp.]
MKTTRRKTGSITAMILIILAFCSLMAVAGGPPLIRTDKDVYNYGENIRVNFYNAPGYSRDWICIVPAGAPDTDAGDYRYIPRRGHGVLTFRARRPGRYEARAYYSYSIGRYVVTARYGFKILDRKGNW